MIRIGFFGTPHLSARVLQDFLNASEFEVSFVVTGEDKLVGRHQVLTTNEVKTLALENSIPVLQPTKIRGNTEFLEEIKTYDVDYLIVVAYGKILPMEILQVPRKYPINIHGSILPKYRGASPIQASLIAGETETGVTIMMMSEGMDEGDIIDIKKIQINTGETGETLFGKFAEISGEFAIETIEKLDRGELSPKVQNENEATYCKKITKEEGLLDFTKTAKELYHLYQGFAPWPGVYTLYKEKKLIIEKCFYEETTEIRGVPGTVIQKEDKTIGIVCGKGLLTLQQVKLEGKKSQSAKEFLNGQQDFISSIL
ncbi:methionyl-tRNA formyltransferase [Candidatus Gracilibacteria bacterium]|nr:methionyl-tRNA formyltransferase [Candidatus Gracilibacteria bacterium]OIO77302.1 MAG: methionyl-tRNA formyltransferase [Candidatus Gracilibacteria bacterium CG1_02_38_174]PIQ11224.1 MAG: methionyl-tRNA formyltransferase [Candidatus Gracilibacteria bacterium CG18_big_fil_WC_8_21_14_2_50_38_16]PIQ41074.1 MAG: methionyl-tRNA formyltransferase [Candidatus Gracilibacteria bacterium CG12_big_fil_rev_8_21_14_0_65_38_15]PIZ01474.1 MAG: methionyl-tRNA formyltransferase [Candidatus Gracilibacteria ba